MSSVTFTSLEDLKESLSAFNDPKVNELLYQLELRADQIKFLTTYLVKGSTVYNKFFNQKLIEEINSKLVCHCHCNCDTTNLEKSIVELEEKINELDETLESKLTVRGNFNELQCDFYTCLKDVFIQPEIESLISSNGGKESITQTFHKYENITPYSPTYVSKDSNVTIYYESNTPSIPTILVPYDNYKLYEMEDSNTGNYLCIIHIPSVDHSDIITIQKKEGASYFFIKDSTTMQYITSVDSFTINGNDIQKYKTNEGFFYYLNPDSVYTITIKKENYGDLTVTLQGSDIVNRIFWLTPNQTGANLRINFKWKGASEGIVYYDKDPHVNCYVDNENIVLSYVSKGTFEHIYNPNGYTISTISRPSIVTDLYRPSLNDMVYVEEEGIKHFYFTLVPPSGVEYTYNFNGKECNNILITTLGGHREVYFTTDYGVTYYKYDGSIITPISSLPTMETHSKGSGSNWTKDEVTRWVDEYGENINKVQNLLDYLQIQTTNEAMNSNNTTNAVSRWNQDDYTGIHGGEYCEIWNPQLVDYIIPQHMGGDSTTTQINLLEDFPRAQSIQVYMTDVDGNVIVNKEYQIKDATNPNNFQYAYWVPFIIKNGRFIELENQFYTNIDKSNYEQL